MQAISRFVRTTIFGGVLFLTPIVVIWFILSKAYNLAGRALQPLAALIPDSLSSRTTITAVLEVLLIALACFLAGLFARTMRAQKIVRELRSVRTLQGPRLRIYEASRREHARRRRDGGLSSHTCQSRRAHGALACRPTSWARISSPCSSPIRRTRYRAEYSSSPPTACVPLASPSPLRWELSDAAAPDRERCSANSQ